jgi:putative redox protein
MAIAARQHGVELRGLRFEVTKEMSTEGPRRIARLTTHLWLPLAKASAPASLLERIAHSCPVHRSIDSSVDKPIIFHWAE